MLIIIRNLAIVLSILSGPSVLLEKASFEFTSDRKIDVIEYEFNLTLSDSSNSIEGRARIMIAKPLSDDRGLEFDLKSEGDEGKGMTVHSVHIAGEQIKFSHVDDLITIDCNAICQNQDTLGLEITYTGIPIDGLVISRNKFNERTFFGDNWPNRARHWLPSNDHPSDKAKVQFNVTAPAHYQVVSNGKLVEENDLGPDLRITKWRSTVDIPTKVMVIGVARFSVQHLDPIGDIPLSSWVYPQDQNPGFEDFQLASEILRFMEELIGEFPYNKLANVQSKTRYGGMENAGAIFYSERAVNSPRSIENLLAHEIAHQWFGDSVTEKDWAHIWLSEGFATYLTAYYVLQTKGQLEYDTLISQMVSGVLRYNENEPEKPIVDFTVQDPNAHLNTNSYQKGGLVLHMLRQKIGDEAFIRTIRSFYKKFRDGNADSNDFKSIAETVSGKKLDQFFEQWLNESELPNIVWTWDHSNTSLDLEIEQVSLFDFNIFIPAVFYHDGGESHKQLELSDRNQVFSFDFDNKPDSVKLSPLGNSLVKIVAN